MNIHSAIPAPPGSGQAPDFGDLPAPVVPQHVQRYEKGQGFVGTVDDVVAAEVPVALVFNGISHAVMMATPQDLEDFALGFALSEGLVDTPADVRDIVCTASRTCADDALDLPAGTQACEVHLEVASHCFARLKDRRRALAGRTGCGVCGIDSLEGLDLEPERVAVPDWLQGLSADAVLRALSGLPALQPLNRLTGAVHAAGWSLPDGTLAEVREDVGRHNALDKLIGRLARTGRLRFGSGGSVLQAGLAAPQPEPGFVAMSSRASYELVRKCARLQLPALATISAPTSLAIRIAERAQVQLWGFCRDPRARRYA